MDIDLIADERRSPIHLIRLGAMKDDESAQPRMTSSKSNDSSKSPLDEPSMCHLSVIQWRDDYF